MAIRGGELVSRCAWTGSGDVRHQGPKGLRGAKWVAPAEPKKGYWRLSEESSDNLKQHLTVLLNASGFFLFFFFEGAQCARDCDESRVSHLALPQACENMIFLVL